MANIIQARKRIRQNAKHKMRNAPLRSKARTAIKNILALIAAKKKKELGAAYRQSISILDKTVSKGLLHKNKVARYKRTLNARIKQLNAG